MSASKKLSDVPPMNDDQLAVFWEKHEPEEFEGWEKGNLNFKRPPKKLIQLRLDPKDVRIIDRESKRSGIDREAVTEILATGSLIGQKTLIKNILRWNEKSGEALGNIRWIKEKPEIPIETYHSRYAAMKDRPLPMLKNWQIRGP